MNNFNKENVKKKGNKDFSKFDNNKPENEMFDVPLIEIPILINQKKYNKKELVELIQSIPFGKISIPIYGYKNLIFDPDKKGTVMIGYVNMFTEQTETFTVTIFNTFVQKVKDFECKVIYPRLRISGETPTYVMGFDLCPQEMYQHLFD